MRDRFGPGPRARLLPLSLFGVLLAGLALSLYVAGVVLAVPQVVVNLGPGVRWFTRALVWYSGVPLVTGLVMILADIWLFLPRRRRGRSVRYEPPANQRLTVVLTAYNDEESIAAAVSDFRAQPRVARVIVVDNNSQDRTAELARQAGAKVVIEAAPGYGRCVFRALSEGLNQTDTELTLLCEGDLTFRAHDIEKFLAYIPHADIVNGTRIVEQLRECETQLTTFMYYGNFAVGKLLELKHLGSGTFTDVGTTYKLCRNSSLRRTLAAVTPSVNLEFNAHFLDTALAIGERIVECPITFYKRVGASKGGNASNARALKVGLRMIFGVVVGWRNR